MCLENSKGSMVLAGRMVRMRLELAHQVCFKKKKRVIDYHMESTLEGAGGGGGDELGDLQCRAEVAVVSSFL